MTITVSKKGWTMRIIVQPLVILDEQERQIVEEALRPYRILTGEDDKKAGEYQLCLNRTTSALRETWLLDTHNKIVELRDALLHESHLWEMRAERAPEDGDTGSLITKPKAAFTMLAETRDRQALVCDRALEILKNAMRVLKPVKEGARSLVVRAESLIQNRQDP